VVRDASATGGGACSLATTLAGTPLVRAGDSRFGHTVVMRPLLRGPHAYGFGMGHPDLRAPHGHNSMGSWRAQEMKLRTPNMLRPIPLAAGLPRPVYSAPQGTIQAPHPVPIASMQGKPPHTFCCGSNAVKKSAGPLLALRLRGSARDYATSCLAAQCRVIKKPHSTIHPHCSTWNIQANKVYYTIMKTIVSVEQRNMIIKALRRHAAACYEMAMSYERDHIPTETNYHLEQRKAEALADRFEASNEICVDMPA
jgi:hypothetical protein